MEEQFPLLLASRPTWAFVLKMLRRGEEDTIRHQRGNVSGGHPIMHLFIYTTRLFIYLFTKDADEEDSKESGQCHLMTNQ